MQDRVFVQREVSSRGWVPARAQIFRQRLQPPVDAPDVLARPGLFGAVAPDRLAFHEFRAQHRALAGHPLGQKRVGSRPARDRLKKRHTGIDMHGLTENAGH